jgi:predicted ATPase
MKISVKNLGAIDQAEFTLGQLTIICGSNNTGKTYVTHATFGFFDYLRSGFRLDVSDSEITSLLSSGTISIDISSYMSDLQKHFKTAAKNYSQILNKVFSGNDKLFENSEFDFSIETKTEHTTAEVDLRFGSAEKSVLQINKAEGSEQLHITLIVDKMSGDVPRRSFIEDMISNSLREIILGSIIPRPFIASAERTGAAIFQKELDFTRNRLIELLGDKSSKLQPIQFLGKFSGEYPLAVRRNVDFIRDLPNITNRESFILKKHPEILDDFRDIIGGEYKVSKDGEIQYIPENNKKIRLSLVESSSAVRSLLDIGFYLRHVATPGDLLMVDEPELNLHPENQRRVARLFARLLNLGIKVFITTHSDYIIKELNTLIMLNQQSSRLLEIAGREGYKADELLPADSVRVYIAEEASIKLDGGKKKTKRQTLVPADIDPKMGIEARSFDKTIEDMNRVQEEIVWGGEE